MIMLNVHFFVALIDIEAALVIGIVNIEIALNTLVAITMIMKIMR